MSYLLDIACIKLEWWNGKIVLANNELYASNFCLFQIKNSSLAIAGTEGVFEIKRSCSLETFTLCSRMRRRHI